MAGCDGLFTLEWTHRMGPLKREQATRVSYNTLTHSRLYCRDREKT